MEDSKRQKQVAGLLHEELSLIFQRLGLNIVEGGMISISTVRVTPDLFEARVYLSFFQIANKADMMQKIRDRAWEIKRELTAKVRHQLRVMPMLTFFEDDTLDYVFKMEELFGKIKAEEARAANGPEHAAD
jgi:ribosome-binding factor A